MDIAAMSMALNSGSVMQQANVLMIKQIMNLQQGATADIAEIMPSPPFEAHLLDTRA